MNGIDFSFDGLGLTILALSLVGIELAANKGIRKVTNTYGFGLGISIFYITYCIVICGAAYGSKFSHTVFVDPTTNPDESDVISKAFMLNICPFLNFMLPISLIADPSRKTARAFAPFAVLSSLMVVLIAVPMTEDIKFDGVNIFIGTAGIPDLYYFGHVTNLLIGLGILLNTPKLGGKGGASVAGTITGFYLYVIIVAYSLGARWQVSGITPNDFGVRGTFSFFEQIFKTDGKTSQVIFFTLLSTTIVGTILLSDLCKRGYFAYGDKYSGCGGKGYDYEKTTIKEPGGGFSHNGQLKHKK